MARYLRYIMAGVVLGGAMAIAQPAAALTLGFASAGTADVLPTNFDLDSNATYTTLDGGVGRKGDDIRTYDNSNAAFTSNGALEVISNPGGTGRAQFTYMGSEAGNENEFIFEIVLGTDIVFSNQTDTVGTTKPAIGTSLAEGVMPFTFRSSNDDGATWSEISNTGTTSGTGADRLTLAFSDWIDEGGGEFSIIAFFNDQGRDTDYDDLAVKIRFSDPVGQVHFVPLPAALPLFLTALGGLGVMGWRRRKAAA